MSDRELTLLFNRHSKELDAMQRARIRELKGLERVLFERMVARMVDALDAGGGAIRTGKGSATINQLVDVIFNQLEKEGLRKFYEASRGDLFKILGNADNYAGLVVKDTGIGDKRFKAMRGEVDRVMRKRIGLDDKGKPIPGGYFDDILKSASRATRTEVKQLINSGVQSGQPLSKLMKSLEITVKGTKDSPGTLTKALRPLVQDAYAQFDRAASDTYAKKLKLDTFVYQGGLIETSRDFCKKRNNKVFTLEEAEEWDQDATLPRTTKERQSGVLTDYDPLRDMGRWNCRHRARYITRGLAVQLRPDLAG